MSKSTFIAAIHDYDIAEYVVSINKIDISRSNIKVDSLDNRNGEHVYCCWRGSSVSYDQRRDLLTQLTPE